MTDTQQAQETQPVTAPGAQPLTTSYEDLDNEALHLIPEAWEAPFQLPIEGMAPEDLGKEDRKAYCEHLLGNLSATFKALREQAQVARVRLWSDGQNDLPATMETPNCVSAEEARRCAIEAVSNWYYRDGQDQKETVAYLGAISSTPHTLNALHELNRLKHEFSELLGKLRDALDPSSHTRGDIHDLVAMLHENASRNVSRKAAGALVRQLLHPRLNIRQLVRSIPIVDELPYSIRWRWIDSPSSVRVGRNKLLDMLERKQANPEAQMDFQRIASVSDPEFCLKKGQSFDLRISVRKTTTGPDETPYMDFKSRLPVFYAAAPAGYYRQTPKLSYAPDNAPKRKRRRQTEDEPFLTTMAVHRYRRESA
ncbi:hypothetical protein [Marinobacter subterrani]|uniref:hypothetical protein n=1 Tax=Marinobacter subterrani TaxID=1658765 RepID=UPI002356790B|nr:hypothetical protein [Marinobacter subterrani]